METVFDVVRGLVHLLGAGEVHDKALAIIDGWEASQKPAKPAPAPAADKEGTAA